MKADDYILKLPNTSFKTKQGLPKHPGIYYVVDDQNREILYIGQSVNINSRWLGRGHHRDDQLSSLSRRRRTTLTIYHEYVKLEFLDITEQKRIDEYSPLLNDSPIKIKQTISAEQLLVESLEMLKENVLILGLEKPRKDIARTLEAADSRKNLTKVSMLELPIVHLLFIPNDPTNFFLIKKYLLQSLLKYTKRSRYAKQWSRIYSSNRDFICHRFNQLSNAKIEDEIKRVLTRINKLTTLFTKLRSLIVGEYLDGEIRCIIVAVSVNEDSIFKTSMNKGKGGWSIDPIFYEFEKKEYKQNITRYTVNNYRFEFIYFFQIIDYMELEDKLKYVNTVSILGIEVKALSSLAFIDNLLHEASVVSIKVHDSYWFTRARVVEEGSYVFYLRPKLKSLESKPSDVKIIDKKSQTTPINYGFNDINSLLLSRGKQTEINSNKFLRKSGFVYQSGTRTYLPLLVASFLGKGSHYSVNTLNEERQISWCHPDHCKLIYFLASGDEKLWLLLGNELKEFIKLGAIESLTKGECYTDKLYFSPRRYIHPARLTVRLTSINYSGSLPFGMCSDFPFYAKAKAEIERRLNALNIPTLKFSFSQESLKS